MKNNLFGNRNLIDKQHELSKEIRLEEAAEEQQKKIKKKYTVNISYSETTTRYYTDKINVYAYNEEEADDKADDWARDQGDDVEVESVEIISEELDPEECDTQTLDMFKDENIKPIKSE